MGSKRIDLTINGSNKAKEAFNQVSGDIRKLGNETKSATSTMNSSLNTTKTRITGLGNTTNSTANKMKSSLSSVKGAVSGLSSAFTGLGGVIASAASGWTLNEMVTSAGKAESAWNRIAIETGKTGNNLATTKKWVFDISNKYGVLSGDSRETYENMVRFEGASQKTNEHFEGILATSKLTGKSTDEIYSAIQSGELGRNKALQKSVLTEAQRKKYLSDGKLTQEEINEILKENTDEVKKHNELTTDSESSWNRMMNSVNKVKTTLGTALLPVVNAAAGTIEWMANGFITLNTLSGGWLGTITGVGVGLVALGAPIALLGKGMKSVWDSAKGTLDSLKGASKTKIKCPTGCSTTGGGSTTTGSNGRKTSSTASKAITILGAVTIAAATVSILGAIQDQQMNAFNTTPARTKQSSILRQKMTPFLNDTGLNALNPGQRIGGAYTWNTLNKGIKWPTTEQILKSINPGLGAATKIKLPSAKDLLLLLQKSMPTIPKWALPSLGSISSWIRSKIPKLNWKWPTLGGIGAWIRSKVPKLNWKWPSWGNIAGYIQSKIPKMHLPSISWSSVAGWIQDKIPKLSWPMGPSGFISGAVNSARSIYNKIVNTVTGPRGPEDNFNNLSLNYQGYAGTRQNAIKGDNCLTGNCLDMSLGLMQMNNGTGGITFGTWNGGPHAWYTDASGRNWDPARKALNGTWLPPARGPSGNGQIIIQQNFQGGVYGDNYIKQVAYQAAKQGAKHGITGTTEITGGY